jgi:hypothetical protein
LLGHSKQDVARLHSSWFRALSLLCVLLTLFFATAQVSHVHNGSSTSADRDCSICSVAHSTAQVAPAFQYAPVFGRTAYVSIFKESSESFRPVSSLFIRPPPSV